MISASPWPKGEWRLATTTSQLGEQIIRKIQLAAGKDIDFGAGEEPEFGPVIGEFLVEGADFGQLLTDALGREAVGLDGGFGMVGDAPVGAAEVLHVGGDFLKRAVAVAPVGVVVEGAFELGPFEEAREGVFFGGVKFTGVLAQFRGNVGEAELLEDVGLGLTGDEEPGVAGLDVGAEEAVFVEAEAALDGALAHDDVVLFAAGEIGEGEGEFGGR